MTIDEAKHVLKTNGKNPNVESKFNDDFLGACKNGNTNLVEAYLVLGVNSNYKSTDYGEPIGLVRAAEDGHIEVIKLLVAHGADMSLVDGDGDTALHTAVNWGQLAVVQTLIELGSPVDNLNKKALTPITGALENEKTAIYKFLMDYSDPNVYAEDSNSFIQKCIYENWTNRINDAFTKFKIKADPNIQNKKGDSLLIHAINYLGDDADKVVKTLIKNGANLNAKNKYGWSPYYFAKHYEFFDIVEILEKKSDLENGELLSDFFEALKSFDKNKVQQCLSMGINKDARDPGGRNALGFISIQEEENIDFFKWLLDSGFQHNVFCAEEKSVVQLAYTHSKKEYTNLLLEAGASPNAKNGNCYLIDLYNGSPDDIRKFAQYGANYGDLSSEMTSFVYGSLDKKKLLDFIKAFGEAKANLNAKDDFTTLFSEMICYKRDLELTKALVEAGADINILDNYNISPIQKLADYYQKDNKTAAIMKYLLEKGCDVDNEGGHGGNLAYIVYHSRDGYDYVEKPFNDFLDKKLEKVLKECGIKDISRPTDTFIRELAEEFTYGHLCAWAYRKRWDIVQILLQGGVPAQPKVPKAMSTALSIAIEQQNIEAVQMVLQAGADPNYPMKYDSYPLIYAAYPSNLNPETHDLILHALLQAGANPNIGKEIGISALTNAISAKSLMGAKTLMKFGADFEFIKGNILASAVAAGDVEMVQWAIELGADIDAVDYYGNSILQIAMNQKNMKMLEFLLTLEGININQANNEGKTALMMAVQEEEIDLIKLLMKRGADIDLQDSEGNSVRNMVHIRPEIAPLVGVEVQAGSTLNLSNVWQETSLSEMFLAIYERDYSKVGKLIDQGCDLNEKDYRGDTPMMVAIITGQADIAELLLKKGADAAYLSPEHECAEGHCQYLGYSYESLKNAIHKKINKPSMDALNGMAALSMNKEKFDKLWSKKDILGIIAHIQKGKVNIVATSPYFFILHEAVKTNDLVLVKALIDVGAIKEAWDEQLNLAMDYAETDEMKKLVRI